jgi:hypothetical protein
MRRPSLSVPCAVLGLVLGGLLLPATSAAIPCVVTSTSMTRVVVADARFPVAGQPYFFVASLRTDSDQPVPNATVELWAKRVGQSGYTKVAQTHSDPDGVASPVTTLTRNTSLYARFPGDSCYSASQTDAVLTYVSTAGTMRVNDRTLRIGQRLVVTGKTYPIKPGLRVTLYRGTVPFPNSPTRPTRLARAYVRADGTFRITKRFHSAGRKRLFVGLPGGSGNAYGYTRYRRVTVG